MTACYCTALRTAARRLTAVYDEALAPLGITIAQFSLLRRIGRAGRLSLTELGRLTDLDRSTVGRNTKVLERMGLVETLEGRDAREAALGLTASGREIVARGAPLWEKTQSRIERHLAAADMHRLLDTLASL